MNDIAPIGRPNYTSLGNTNRRGTSTSAPANSTSRGGDEVQLSNSARYLSQLHDMPDVREAKVAEIRAAIDDGTYDTEEKVDAILDPLAEDLV